MRTFEDGVWRYYNCPDPFWSAKCRRCREKVAELKAPVEECLNCWKVEIWGFSQEQDRLVCALAQRGLPVVAKASRAPILVVRTGMPLEAYPPGEVECLLMLYASTIEERDRLRREAETLLAGSVLAESVPGSVVLPIRRGCWRYDDLLGPWETWPEKSQGPSTRTLSHLER